MRLTKRYKNGAVTVDADAFGADQGVLDSEIGSSKPIKAAVARLAEMEDRDINGCVYCEDADCPALDWEYGLEECVMDNTVLFAGDKRRSVDIDCNYCKHLNMAEAQQQNKENGNSFPHICQYYKRRVFHRTREKSHNSKLFPCVECSKHNYRQFLSGRADNE